MSEWRKDPILDRWVIIAKNRAERPLELTDAPAARSRDTKCPFCEGNEHDTPHEIAAVRANGTSLDQPGWQVRVVPNRYPAVVTAPPSDPCSDDFYQATPGDSFYLTTPGVGAHEVIIESPQHLVSVSELSEETLRDVFGMYRSRLLALKEDKRLAHATIFKNVGAAAGASIEHTHSQLIATPLVPTQIALELDGGERFYRSHRRCAYCETLERELALGERIVLETPRFVTFCPFASRFPYETWIVPREHSSHYETLSLAQAAQLGQIMKRSIEKIEAVLDRVAYNSIIHTAPFDTFDLDHYHWHIEIIPRVTKTAGFEWGTGLFINSVPPEEAATVLRG